MKHTEIHFRFFFFLSYAVVESIMRGEVVGMTPRRSRSSTALTHALVVVSEIQFRSIIKRSAYNLRSASIINRRYISTYLYTSHISHTVTHNNIYKSCLQQSFRKLIYSKNIYFYVSYKIIKFYKRTLYFYLQTYLKFIFLYIYIIRRSVLETISSSTSK